MEEVSVDQKAVELGRRRLKRPGHDPGFWWPLLKFMTPSNP
jgi:hypothetical protein